MNTYIPNRNSLSSFLPACTGNLTDSFIYCGAPHLEIFPSGVQSDSSISAGKLNREIDFRRLLQVRDLNRRVCTP
jgi:hypothetical protein